MREAVMVLDGFTLTEGMRWHEDRVWFSDLYNHRVCSMAEDGSAFRVEGVFDGIPCGIGWLPDGRLLVALQESKLVMRREGDGTLVIHADLSEVSKGWLNDMIVAPDGTAYVGCHGFDINHNEPFVVGPLMKVSIDGWVTVVGEPAHFSNGATISGGDLIIAESFANRISRYRIEQDGALTGRTDWATFGPMPTAVELDDRYAQLVVAPDGISGPDAEGAIWVADFTAQYAIRVLPGGEIIDRVGTGDLNCFCAALGGADGRTLFLCVAPAELNPEVRKSQPRGGIMSFRVDVPLGDDHL